MAVYSAKVLKNDPLGHKVLVVPLITATNQADVKAFGFTPGYRFEVVAVKAYCLNEAGAVTLDVKIGATSVLTAPVAFAAAAEVDGALVAAASGLRGDDTDQLAVHYTSDGTGALTNGFAVVVIRPFGMHGDGA